MTGSCITGHSCPGYTIRPDQRRHVTLIQSSEICRCQSPVPGHRLRSTIASLFAPRPEDFDIGLERFRGQ